MADTPLQSSKAPWHLWVVGVVSLLWNSVGALDFVMTQTHNAAYLKSLTPVQLEFFFSYPLWVVIAWGVATWGGVVGSLLMLFRRCLAVQVFLASIIGMVLTTFYNFVLADGLKVMGAVAGLTFAAVIFVIGLLLWIYARAMRRRGVMH